MEEKDVRKLLKAQSGQAVRRGWSCPDEIQLAAYGAQSLSSPEKNSVEAHVADCDFCLNQLAFLTQSADWRNSEEVPADLLVGARKLVSRKSSKLLNWGWKWAAVSGAVACIALMVVLIAVRRQESVLRPSDTLLAQQASPEPITSPRTILVPPPARPEPSQSVQPPKRPRIPEVRSTTAEEMLPRLITPRDGEVVRQDLELRWMPVPDAIFYDVRVMSAEGNIVFEKQSEKTTLTVGSDEPLLPGTKYFAVIRAHLRQGKVVKSTVKSFRLAER